MISEELRVTGWAKVVSIDACPQLDTGPGEAVIGRFVTRRVDETVQVTFSNGEILEGTPIHPIWSPERSDWILLGDVVVGERVLGRDGEITIERVKFRDRSVPVYNLEINGEHVYEVTRSAVLVHNTTPCTSNVGNSFAPKTFSSFDALKRGLGSAGEGNVWHHIVEQRLAGKFGAEAIHSSENVVAVNQSVNQAIANYYSSIPRSGFTGGQTVRQWLGTQSFAEQAAFGRRILDAVLKNLPLP